MIQLRTVLLTALLVATLALSLALGPGSSRAGDDSDSGSGLAVEVVGAGATEADSATKRCQAMEARVAALEERAEDLRSYMAEYREEVTPMDLIKHELLRVAARWPWVRRLRDALGIAP